MLLESNRGARDKKYYLNLHDHKIPFLYVTAAFIFFLPFILHLVHGPQIRNEQHIGRVDDDDRRERQREQFPSSIFSSALFPRSVPRKKGYECPLISIRFDEVTRRTLTIRLHCPPVCAPFLSPALLFYHWKHMFLFFILFLSSTRSSLQERKKKIHPLPSRFSGTKAITQRRRSSSRPQEGFFFDVGSECI